MTLERSLGLAEQEAFGRFVNAASYLTGCLSAILVIFDGMRWKVTSTYGAPPTLNIDGGTAGWLEVVLSCGDVVEFNPVLHRDYWLPVDFEQDPECLVCVAIRDPATLLSGVVMLVVPLPHIPLSAAQIYGLQTHAARFYATSPCDTVNSTAGSVAIERLRLLESVVVNAKDAILITEAEPIDLPGPRIVYCNPAFLVTTGFALEEVIGKTPRILQCEETNRETLQQLRVALEQWKPIELELINARRDGSRFWVQLSIVPVANEKGWFTHWVSVQRDITERKDAEKAMRQAQLDREERVALQSRLVERERIQEELSYSAFHDELTRLKNRAYFMGCIQLAFSEGGEGNVGAATVLYLDLDRFKYVNDGMGHHAGDFLLKQVAERLDECVNADALTARIGGDEFAILLKGEGQQEPAIDTAKRVIHALGLPIEVEGQMLFTSCSIGIATLDAYHTSAEDLIRDADVAMYAAKKKGRGRYAIFDMSMRQGSVNTLVLQNALKHAIACDEFYLVFQPIFSLTTELITGVEALMRWRHPTLGNVSPEVFITIAEDIGVIYDLGRWVMRNACQEVKRWRNICPETAIKLNVNVSGIELNRRDFAAQVSDMLVETEFDARDLQIEITESVFLREPQVVAQTLGALRDQGIRVALDDFGTGYSSLGYIDRYPIDVIKIDRSFVSRMMSHERSVAIVKGILSLGQALDLAIVAEGVETQSQLQQLKSLGCPYVQGFLLSPPLLPKEVQALLGNDVRMQTILNVLRDPRDRNG